MKPRVDLDKPTLDLSEAAAFLGIGYANARDLVDSGELPCCSLSQRHHLLLRSDLEEWVRAKARQQAAERREARRAPQPSPAAEARQAPQRRGRERRPLPDLTPYERLPDPRPQKSA